MLNSFFNICRFHAAAKFLTFLSNIIKMQYLSVVLFFLAFSLAVNAQDSIEGIWNTGNENTKIEIKEVDGKLVGQILSSANEKAKIGATLSRNIQAQKGEWTGELFAAKRGKWVDAALARAGDVLNITVSSGWMSKTIAWKKAD